MNESQIFTNALQLATPAAVIDVTRIERPGGAPFYEPDGYSVWNRGKRSAELDLTTDADRETFLALAETRPQAIICLVVVLVAGAMPEQGVNQIAERIE